MSDANSNLLINSIYTSVSCNRTPNSLDWGGKSNEIIYAFSNSIAILSKNEPYQIKATFNKHLNRVNCVKWIRNLTNNELFNYNEFISGSTDKTICVWQGDNYDVSVVVVVIFHIRHHLMKLNRLV